MHHGSNAPIGYELRYAGAPNWVRFHSLPRSKRYADTNEERVVLLHRQNRLALEVLGDGPCWIAQSHWPSEPAIEALDPFRATRELGLERAFCFLPLTLEGDEWTAHSRLTTWSESASDNLLLSIADEQASPTLWMSASTGAIFAPYDGGVDLFLASTEEVARLKAAYADWLSDHPEGL